MVEGERPTSRACRDPARLCIFQMPTGERCKAPRLKTDKLCYWHSQKPSIIKKREWGRKSHEYRCALKPDNLPNLNITDPSELAVHLRELERLALTGELSLNLAKFAGELASKQLAAFSAACEWRRIGRLRPV